MVFARGGSRGRCCCINAAIAARFYQVAHIFKIFVQLVGLASSTGEHVWAWPHVTMSDEPNRLNFK